MNNIINSLIAAFIAMNGETDQFRIVPDGYKLEDLELFDDNPRRIRQKVLTHTARSFCKYVKEFKTETTVIFANKSAQAFEAHLEYHDSVEQTASWNGHKVTYTCPIDLRWKTWTGSDGKSMSQVEFARFIENNLPDIVSPSGSDMLTISKALQAKKSVDFKSDQRLSNGDIQFTYNETTTATSGAGSLEVPEEFTLGIPVYEGGQAYEVKARLRYRINEGKLSMWYELIRPERMQEDAFQNVMDEITKATDGILTFEAQA